MGNCIYCGNPAGLISKKHSDCEQKHSRGQELIKDAVLSAIKGDDFYSNLQRNISVIETSSYIEPPERKEILTKAFSLAVDNFLEDGVLDEHEEQRLMVFKEHFGLSNNELDKDGSYTRITKAIVLRELLNGVVVQRVNLSGSSINFQKDEKIVWAFSNVEYLEDKVKKTYAGVSSGVSLKIMKGVYYRVGAFKGNVIESTERTRIDKGAVVFTDKHIYFAGNAKSLRVPYSKIISFVPFKNGLGILKDNATAKPQIFVTGDGWFSYNLAINLAKL